MPNIQLKTLNLTGFRSFHDTQSINFPPNGLVLIRGANGSGKSSICLGIAHALGYSSIPTTKLQNWTEDATDLSVGLSLQVDDTHVYVHRAAKPSIHISGGPDMAGVSFSGTTALQIHLDKLLGLSPEILEALTYRPQRRPGLFINKTDAEKKEFLCGLLRLDKFEVATEKAAARLKELTTLLAASSALHEAKVNELFVARDALKEPVYEDVAALGEELGVLELKIADLRALFDQANSKMSLLNIQAAQESDELKELRAQYHEIDKRTSTKAVELNLKHREFDTLIRNSECPTCKRPFDGPSEALQTFPLEISGLQATYDKFAALREEKVQEMKLLLAKETAARNVQVSRQEETVARIQVELDSVEKRYREVRDTKSAFTMTNAVAKSRYEAANAHLTDIQRNVDYIRATVETLAGDHAAEQDFIALVGREGFLGAIFDEVLVEISEETNRMLSQIPNVSHVTIHFTSETTTQKGKVRKEIVPIICINGHVAPMVSGCSGGMQASIELVVDLALATVISRRTGVVPGWLILDEVFSGIDRDAKEACFQILEHYSKERLILVVEHDTEFQEMFTHCISVANENGQSKIVSTVSHSIPT